jgi:hypothetical protein
MLGGKREHMDEAERDGERGDGLRGLGGFAAYNVLLLDYFCG